MQVIDPVCEMVIDTGDEGVLSVDFGGEIYWFCCAVCREEFESHPEWYAPEYVEEEA